MEAYPDSMFDIDSWKINYDILNTLNEAHHKVQLNIIRKYVDFTIKAAIEAIYQENSKPVINWDQLNEISLNHTLKMKQFLHKNISRHLPQNLIENVFYRNVFETSDQGQIKNPINTYLFEEWSLNVIYLVYVENLWVDELINIILTSHKTKFFFDAMCFLVYHSFRSHIQFVNKKNLVKTMTARLTEKKIGPRTTELIISTIRELYDKSVADMIKDTHPFIHYSISNEEIQESARNNDSDAILSIADSYFRIMNYTVLHFYTQSCLDEDIIMQWLNDNVSFINFKTMHQLMDYIIIPSRSVLLHHKYFQYIEKIKHMWTNIVRGRETPTVNPNNFIDSLWKSTLSHASTNQNPQKTTKFAVSNLEEGYIQILRNIKREARETTMQAAIQASKTNNTSAVMLIDLLSRFITALQPFFNTQDAKSLEESLTTKTISLVEEHKKDSKYSLIWVPFFTPEKKDDVDRLPTEKITPFTPEKTPEADPREKSSRRNRRSGPRDDQSSTAAMGGTPASTDPSESTDASSEDWQAMQSTDDEQEIIPIPCTYTPKNGTKTKKTRIHHTQRSDVPSLNIPSDSVDEMAHFPYLQESFIKNDYYAGFKQYAFHCYYKYMASTQNPQNAQLQKSVFQELKTAQKKLTEERGEKITRLLGTEQTETSRILSPAIDKHGEFDAYIAQLTIFKGDGEVLPPYGFYDNVGANFTPVNRTPIRKIIDKDHTNDIFETTSLHQQGLACARMLLKTVWNDDEFGLNEHLTDLADYLSQPTHQTTIGSNFNDFDDTSFQDTKASANSKYIKLKKGVYFYLSTAVPSFSAIRGYMNPFVLKKISQDIKSIMQNERYTHSFNLNIRLRLQSGEFKTYYWQIYRHYKDSFNVYHMGYVADQIDQRLDTMHMTQFSLVGYRKINPEEDNPKLAIYKIDKDKLYTVDENFMFSLHTLGIQKYWDDQLMAQIEKHGFHNKSGYIYNFSFWNLAASCFEFTMQDTPNPEGPNKFLTFYTLVHRVPEFADPNFKLFKRQPRENSTETLLKQQNQLLVEEVNWLKKQVGHVKEIGMEPVQPIPDRKRVTNIDDWLVFGLVDDTNRSIFYRIQCHGDQKMIDKMQKIDGSLMKSMIDEYFKDYKEREKPPHNRKIWDQAAEEVYKSKVLPIERIYPRLPGAFFRLHKKSKEWTAMWHKTLFDMDIPFEVLQARDRNGKYHPLIQAKLNNFFRYRKRHHPDLDESVDNDSRPHSSMSDRPPTPSAAAPPQSAAQARPASEAPPSYRRHPRGRDKSGDVRPGAQQRSLFNTHNDEHKIQELQNEVDSLRRSLNQIALLKD